MVHFMIGFARFIASEIWAYTVAVSTEKFEGLFG